MKPYTIKKHVEIHASKERVWEVLVTPELFAKWADAFSPGAKMQGDWDIGGTVIYTDKEGMGLKGKVIEFKPHERVTVEYTDVLENFKESPTASSIDPWAGCRETYILSEKNGVTHLTIESQVPTKEFYDEHSKSWDVAVVKMVKLALLTKV